MQGTLTCEGCAQTFPIKDGVPRFASMAEVVRRRYSRILLEARDANPDAAEFSQEEAMDGLQRLERKTPNPETIRG